MRCVNVGALLGLDQWRRDAFYTGLHADWIQRAYPGVEVAVSAPRMRPHEGSFNDIHPASERDLVQYIQGPAPLPALRRDHPVHARAPLFA